MEAIQKDHDRLVKKSNLSKPLSQVDKILTQLTAARAQLTSDPDPTPTSSAATLTKLQAKLTPHIAQLNNDQKDIYNALGKYSKALDRKFQAAGQFPGSSGVSGSGSNGTSTDNPYPHHALAGEEALINRAIAMHLIREGNFDVASTFLREASSSPTSSSSGLDVSEALFREFRTLYEILEAMQERRDLGPAIAWARSRERQLAARGSDLEFELCRLQYIWYFMEEEGESGGGEGEGVEGGGSGKMKMGNRRALEYAQREFGRFQDKYLPAISQLLTAYAFLPTLPTSPYAHLFRSPPHLWSTVSAHFTREFCSLLHLSAESPLFLATTAGAIALPTLLKMNSIMRAKKTEWSTAAELPVETPLPGRFQFHSVFVCPVSKDQTTEGNPPMMLPCGHVIAKESLVRLAKGGGQVLVKCPYCPRECVVGQAKRVYL